MNKNYSSTKKHPYVRIIAVILIIFIVLCAAIISLYISRDYFIKRYLSNHHLLKQHTVKYSKSKLYLFPLGIQLAELQILPLIDSISPLHSKYKIKAELHTVSIKVPIKSAINSKKGINLDYLSIGNGSINIEQYSRSTTIKDNNKVNSQQNKKYYIGTLQLENIALSILTPDNHKFISQINTLKAHHIELDEIANQHQKTLSQQFYLNISDLVFRNNSEVYTFTIESFIIDSEKKKFEINDLSLKPHSSIKYLLNRAPFQKNVYDIQIDKISIPDFHNIHSKDLNAFELKKINIHHLEFHDYKNKNKELNKQKIRPLPIDMIDKIPFACKIDSIIIDNSSLNYHEIPKKEDDFVNIFFERSNITITNIFNKEYRKSIEDKIIFPHLKIEMNAYFLGQAYANILLTNNYYATDEMNVVGSFDQFDLTHLDKITEKEIGIDITSGISQELKFAGKTKRNLFTGTIEFKYKNLTISFNPKFTLHFSEIKTDIARIFIKKENPKPGKRFREKNFKVERNPNKSFINFLWKGVFQGIQKTVGIPHKPINKKHKKGV